MKTGEERRKLGKGQACIVLTRTFGEQTRDLEIFCDQKAVETMLKMPHIRDFPYRVVTVLPTTPPVLRMEQASKMRMAHAHGALVANLRCARPANGKVPARKGDVGALIGKADDALGLSVCRDSGRRSPRNHGTRSARCRGRDRSPGNRDGPPQTQKGCDTQIKRPNLVCGRIVEHVQRNNFPVCSGYNLLGHLTIAYHFQHHNASNNSNRKSFHHVRFAQFAADGQKQKKCQCAKCPVFCVVDFVQFLLHQIFGQYHGNATTGHAVGPDKVGDISPQAN